MTDTFGIAVIGAGKMGSDHIDVIRTKVAGAKVVAAVDIDIDRAAAAISAIPDAVPLATAKEAFERGDVHGVLIAAPGPFHEEILHQALERDLPILCEKPLTPDPESSWRIVQAEHKLGHRRIQVGFMRRFDESYTQIKDAIDQDTLGNLLLLHCAHRAPEIAPAFTTEMLISDSVVHEFDIIRHLSGSEIASVQVRSGRKSRGALEHLHDPQHVLVETANGVLADVEIFVNAQYGYQVTTEAVFEQGIINTGETVTGSMRLNGQRTSPVPKTYVGRFGDAYAREIQSWVDAAKKGGIGGPSAWDGYAAAACCEAGIRSQSSGQREAVSLKPRPDIYAAVDS